MNGVDFYVSLSRELGWWQERGIVQMSRAVIFSFRGLQMKVNHKIAPFFLLGKRTIMSVQNNLFFTVCRTAAPG